MSGSGVDSEDVTFAYRALKATIKPIKAMREQWRGALLASAVLLPTLVALVSYAFFQEQNRVDRLEVELKQMRNETEALRRDCQHVSPARMLKLDTTDNDLDKRIDAIEKRIRRR